MAVVAALLGFGFGFRSADSDINYSAFNYSAVEQNENCKQKPAEMFAGRSNQNACGENDEALTWSTCSC